ncbi:MAG: S-layer homology domain-containing protein [Hormoscilla sp.]
MSSTNNFDQWMGKAASSATSALILLGVPTLAVTLTSYNQTAAAVELSGKLSDWTDEDWEDAINSAADLNWINDNPNSEIGQLYQDFSLAVFGEVSFETPLKGAYIADDYRNSWETDFGKYGYHGGIDIGGDAIRDAPRPVYSIVDGTVEYVQENLGIVSIKDSEGRYHIYKHLDEIYVSKDQSVTTRQEEQEQPNFLGKTGSKGGVAPHLHYEVSTNNLWGALQGIDIEKGEGYNLDKKYFREVNFNPLKTFWEMQPEPGYYFSDVPDSHPFAGYINLLKDWEVIDGYEDGTYRPNEPVSRRHMSKFIVNGFNLPQFTSAGPYFPDVPLEDDFFSYIHMLRDLQIVNGFPDGTYHPDENVTRGQMAKFVVNGAAAITDSEIERPYPPYCNNNQSRESVFVDIPCDHVFASQIDILKSEGIIDGFPDGTYHPDENVTRGQLAKFIVNAGLVAKGLEPLSPTSAGWNQDLPKMADFTEDDWQVFIDGVSGLWFDPPTNYGFEFEAIGDTLFTSILDLPTGIDADNSFGVWVGDTLLGEFSPGETVDFGSGVSSFSVTGIDGSIDPNSPTAFPIKLAFNDFTGSFRMRPFDEEPQSVPEPSSLLGLLAVGALGTVSMLKRKQNLN